MKPETTNLLVGVLGGTVLGYAIAYAVAASRNQANAVNPLVPATPIMPPNLYMPPAPPVSQQLPANSGPQRATPVADDGLTDGQALPSSYRIQARSLPSLR